MPSPFPGMDPYLETPRLWPDVHHELISQIRAALNPLLRPRYVARVELRVYISGEDDPGIEVIVPDLRVEEIHGAKEKMSQSRAEATAVAEPETIPILVDEEIKESRVEIRHVQSDELVTVIEILSPANKVPGSRGRESFLAKRKEIFASKVHWVEIDLLRAGKPSMERLERRACDYRIVVARSERRRSGQFWPVSVRQALPIIGIPLRGQDEDIPLDLGAVLRATYDNGAYDSSINYRRDPEPPLSKKDAAWAAKLLRQKGLR
jgi:hypothetical protein